MQIFIAKEAVRFDFWDTLQSSFNLPWQVVLAIALLVWNFSRMGSPVYLLDFSTFEPPESWKTNREQLIEAMSKQPSFTEESLKFMDRMLAQSGVGPSTAWPPGIVQCLRGEPYDNSVEASRKEAEVSLYNSMLTKSFEELSHSFVIYLGCDI